MKWNSKRFKGEIDDKSLSGIENQSNKGQVDAGRMNYYLSKYFQTMQIFSKEVIS